MGRARRTSLIALTGLTGFAAWYGTWLLIAGGRGTVPFDPPTWLPGGWTGGGLALAVAVAVPMTMACALLLATHPRGRRAAFISGWLLMAWIVVQVLAIGYQMLLQPLMFIIGAITAALAWPLWGGRDPGDA